MIRKSQLSKALLRWIEGEVGVGPGIGKLFYLATAITDESYKWMLQQGISTDNVGIDFTEVAAAMTAGRNDTMVVLPGLHSQDAVMTFSKDYSHILGAVAPTMSGGRARFDNTMITATTGEFVISSKGSIIKNLHFQTGINNTAASVIGVSMTGDGRNYFENCYFEGSLGALVGAAANNKVLSIGAGVQDLTFNKCLFGNHTILNTSSTASVVYFVGPNSTNINFDDCVFQNYMSDAGGCTLRFAASAMPTSGWTYLKRCTFLNLVNVNYTDMILMTSAASGNVTLDACSFGGLGTKVYCTSAHKSNIYVCNAAGAATGGVGANPA